MFTKIAIIVIWFFIIVTLFDVTLYIVVKIKEKRKKKLQKETDNKDVNTIHIDNKTNP